MEYLKQIYGTSFNDLEVSQVEVRTNSNERTSYYNPSNNFISMLNIYHTNSTSISHEYAHYFDHKNIKEVDHIMAAAVIIRPEVVKKIGLFDEKLSLHYNDLDFSLRVKKNGWKIVFYPEAKVIHYMSETTRKHNLKLELFDEMYSNLFYFVRKNYGPLNVLFFKILIMLGFIPRTFYWHCRKLFADNQKVSEMSRFSIKSIRAASTLWKLNY